MNNYELAELVSTWKYGDCFLEVDGKYSLDVVTLFDHDFEFHILVKEWNFISRGHFPTYSLWFIGQDNTSFIQRWTYESDNHYTPFVEAAEIVSGWQRMCVEYSDMEYGNGF